MKKFLSVILVLSIVFLLCGCSTDADNNISDTKTNIKQEVTIVKMPSPPKCKTTDNSSVVNDILRLLNELEKTPSDKDVANGGWSTMIKLNIDGKEFVYTIGSLFTDSDGKQYCVSNYQEIEEKLTKIYNELDVVEVDYP